MGFRDRHKRTLEIAQPEEAPPWAGAPGDSAATYLDAGCELSGELRFKESVRIDGRVEGEIHCAKTVHVGASADLVANIEAESVVISGAVAGDIVARRKITLHKTAAVQGDMKTAGIAIEEGARFKGSISIGLEEPAPRPEAAKPPGPPAAPPPSDGDAS